MLFGTVRARSMPREPFNLCHIISSIVILFGAQLNSEIEHQTIRDSTVRGNKPRGAVMADTVGKAQHP